MAANNSTVRNYLSRINCLSMLYPVGKRFFTSTWVAYCLHQWFLADHPQAGDRSADPGYVC